MSSLILSFPGMKPKSKQHSGSHNGKRHYVKPEYTEWKNEVALEAKIQARKKKWEMPNKEKILSMEIEAWGSGRFDCDNLAGGIMDALIGVIYDDDRQIKHLTVRMFPKVSKLPNFIVTIKAF